MEGYSGKVAVVTGAGSGIGRALAIELARSGAKVAISDVDIEGLSETERQMQALGAEVRADLLNVVEREAFLLYADSVTRQFGKVNQIFNNAGIAYAGDVGVSPFKDMERIFDVDFWGVVNGTKAFLPHLIASGDGHVINVSSLFGLLSLPGQSAYNAAKFAVRGFTESLRQEMIIGRKRSPSPACTRAASRLPSPAMPPSPRVSMCGRRPPCSTSIWRSPAQRPPPASSLPPCVRRSPACSSDPMPRCSIYSSGPWELATRISFRCSRVSRYPRRRQASPCRWNAGCRDRRSARTTPGVCACFCGSST